MHVDPNDLLLGDRMAPVTSIIGFVDERAEVVCEAFAAWQRAILARRSSELRVAPVGGDLEGVLTRLLPLTSVERRRYLFVPTQSGWTAFFDNGHRGTDAFAPISHLCRTQGWRGLRALAVPHTYKRDGGGRYGGLSFELFGPSPPADRSGYQRIVSLMNDGGRWRFQLTGDPLPFERQGAYGARRKTDRFTLELLREYLEQLGIRAFEAGWYMPAGEHALLAEKHGEVSEQLRELTLAEARAAAGA